MLFEKSKETNFIVLMTLVLVMLVSVAIFSEEMLPKQPSPPTFKEKVAPKVEKLPPVEFVIQNRLQVTPTESFVLDIIPTNEVSALVYRFEVLFDPKILSVKEITIGNFFKKPRILRKEINNESGNVYFSAGVTPEEMAVTGEPKNKNLLASLIFEVKPLANQQKKTETIISFGEKTLIISKETEFENLNQVLKPITIIITGNQND